MTPAPSAPALRQLLDALDRLNGVEDRARQLAQAMAKVCVDEGRVPAAQDLVTAAQESLLALGTAPAVPPAPSIEVRLPSDRPVTRRGWHHAILKWRLVRLSSLIILGCLLAHLVVAALATSSLLSPWDGAISGVGLVGAGFAWWVSGVWLKALAPLAPNLARLGWARYWKPGSVGRAYLEQVQRSELDVLLWMDAQSLARQMGGILDQGTTPP